MNLRHLPPIVCVTHSGELLARNADLTHAGNDLHVVLLRLVNNPLPGLEDFVRQSRLALDALRQSRLALDALRQSRLALDAWEKLHERTAVPVAGLPDFLGIVEAYLRPDVLDVNTSTSTEGISQNPANKGGT